MAGTHPILSFITYLSGGVTGSYTSLLFFCGLLIFLLVYFLMKRQNVKAVWILIANLVFYAWAGGWSALIIVFATGLIVYLVSRRIETIYSRSESKKLDPELKKRAKRFLVLALLLILAVWAYIKIGKLIMPETVVSFQDWFSGKGIIVPLGISYYSLSCIGYLLDVFWRKTKPEHNFLWLFTVITYFPHIVQGPIGRYGKLMEQLRALPTFDFQRVSQGLQLMLWGYFKKLVIADRIAIFTTEAFGNYSSYSGSVLAVALVLSTFQIYMDFSGCVDIARGISQAIGIELDKNFNRPFFARSAEEFWQRWHITLSTWFKNYVYYPILVSPWYKKRVAGIAKNTGATASKVFATLIPLGAVWLLTGVWHGTGWNYIIWGGYYGALMITSSLFGDCYKKWGQALRIDMTTAGFQFFQRLRTWVIFAGSRLLTISTSLVASAVILKRMVTAFQPWALFDGTLYSLGLDVNGFVIVAIGLAVVGIVSILEERRQTSVREMIAGQGLVLRWILYLALIFAIILFGIYGPGYDASAFVYANF